MHPKIKYKQNLELGSKNLKDGKKIRNQKNQRIKSGNKNINEKKIINHK